MRILLNAVASMIVFAGVCTSLPADERPNIVVMLADDLGWNGVGFHGDWMETPNIDSIATSGIELDRFYVAPMCSPTRAGLLTGRYPIRFGLARAVIPPYRNFGLPPEETTLAEALVQAGYKHRGVFGKWHLGHHHRKWHPLSQGFTHFEGHYNGAIDYFELSRDGQPDWHVNQLPTQRSGYATDLIAEAASKFIQESAKSDAPYFCYIPFNAPHSPFQAKQKDIQRFAPGRKVTKLHKLQAMIWSLDQAVGKVLASIEATGESDNTQVWFLSDNGGVGGFKENNLPLRGSKLTTFEGGVRVVACVRWPAKWPGSRKVSQTMGYIDVLPTILQSAGEPISRGKSRPLDGVSLHGLLSGKTETLSERDWFSYHGQAGVDTETIAIRSEPWKLVVNGPDIRPFGQPIEHHVFLFNIASDPNEKVNLIDNHPQVAQQLFAKLKHHRSLQPSVSVPPYGQGSRGFTPWENWDIQHAPGSAQ